MCFKPSMIHYTLNLSDIPFFNIIPNEVKHINIFLKKYYIAHSIFMKMQPCLCSYQNLYFLFEIKKIKCSFSVQNHT
jgi:hypothetical protein